jgi:hypothetical protein
MIVLLQAGIIAIAFGGNDQSAIQAVSEGESPHD